jgi:mono/diheme cytochrome c family protein
MKTVIVTLAGLGAVVFLGAFAFIYFGVFNVAANDPHWPITYRILETARIQSIKARAAGIKAPTNLNDHARIVGGTSHFADHCASCHSAPGVEAEDMAEGMYPKPPALTNAAKKWTPSELFWIVKNGIKMSGMPSWADHGDEDLWNIVAFIEKLPGLSEADYGKLVAESAAAGGHMMYGNMSMKMDGQSGPATPASEPKK